MTETLTFTFSDYDLAFSWDIGTNEIIIRYKTNPDVTLDHIMLGSNDLPISSVSRIINEWKDDHE